MGKVAISIMNAKKDNKRPGWHRGADEEKAKLIEENKQLKEKIALLKRVEKNPADRSKMLDQSFYDKKITLHYTEMANITFADAIQDKKTIEVSLAELFKFVSLRLTGKKSVNEFVSAVSDFQDGYWVNSQDALMAKNQYEQFGLIRSSLDKDNDELIELTELGKKVRDELNAL